jgi:tetratricopeptide (TPR) repeat protein/transcriptional regulator with XRE-family HTH domain
MLETWLGGNMARGSSSAAPRPLALFCARLKRLQQAASLTQASLAAAAARSPQQMSAILNGQIRKPPDWTVVEQIVETCLARAREAGRLVPPDLCDREDWRRRYFDLEQDLEAEGLGSVHSTNVQAVAGRIPWNQSVNDIREALTRVGDVPAVSAGNRPLYRLEQLAGEPAGLGVEEARAQPSRMLLARYEIVPFAGRDGFLQRLSDWLRGADPVSARLVHGPGGQGKTRLAMRFARGYASGWVVWQARHGLVSSQGSDRLAVPDAAAGVLVIVDYADRWAASHLQALIADLRARIGRMPGGLPLRFLLLARSAGFWWSGLEDLLDGEYGIPAGASGLPLLGEDVDRKELFAAARDWFATRMGVPGASQIPFPAELNKPAFGHVLTAHMAALTAVDAYHRSTVPPRGPQRISAYLLRRERAHWHELHVRTEDPMVTSPQVMGRAVFVATLAGPLPRVQGIEVLGQVGVATQADTASQILDDHQSCYPPRDGGTVLEPLYPDRLGEDFLALTTPGHHLSLTDDWAATAIARLLAPSSSGAQRQKPPPYASQAITVLVETAHQWPHFAQSQLYPLLCRNPRLALAAGPATLSRVIALPDVDLDVLIEIDSCLIDPHGELDIELHRVAAELAERVFNSRLDQAADPQARAAAHLDFGRKLGNAAQYENARDKTSVAVDLYRELHATSGEYRPDLAMALTQLAYYLDELQDPENARASTEQAIAVWRKLPNSEMTRPRDVAESFNALGVVLRSLGDEEGARTAFERALQLRERHHEQLPEDLKRKDALVAASLLNISNTFLSSRQWGEAKSFASRSVQAYRTAIEAGHRGGGRVGLMRALSSLADAQWELGEQADAIKNSRESAEHALTLARANPAAHSEELAAYLSELRSRLGSVGRIDDALSFTEEVIEFYRQDENERRVVKTNAYLTSFLEDLGRYEEAISSARAEVTARQKPAETKRPGNRADLARALQKQGELSWKAGEHLREVDGDKDARAISGQAEGELQARTDLLAEAEASFTAALALYRHMQDPLGEAGTLQFLGRLYSTSGRDAEADTSFTAALNIFMSINDRSSVVATLAYRGQHRTAGRRSDGFLDWRRALDLAITADSWLFGQVVAFSSDQICQMLMSSAIDDFLATAAPTMIKARSGITRPLSEEEDAAHSLALTGFGVFGELAAIKTSRPPPTGQERSRLIEAARRFDDASGGAYLLASVAEEILMRADARIANQPLAGLAADWVQTPTTWEESERFLMDHYSELLSDDGRAALAALAEASPASETLGRHLDLLDAARTRGVTVAYHQLRAELNAERLGPVVRSWLACATDWAASAAYYAEHADQLSDPAAIARLADACRYEPGDHQLWLHLGLMLLGNQRPDGYGSVAAGEPDPLQRAEALLTDSRLVPALAWACLARAQDEGTGALLMARIQLARHEPDQAAEALASATMDVSKDHIADVLTVHEALLRIQPTEPWWHAQHAWVLGLADRHAEALAAYDQAITLDPGNPSFHFNKGDLLYEMGRFDEAIPLLMEVTRLRDDVLGAHVLLGTIAWPTHPEKAREHFATAISSPGTLLTLFTRALYRAIA